MDDDRFSHQKSNDHGKFQGGQNQGRQGSTNTPAPHVNKDKGTNPKP